jgi:hypothetical protein
MPSLVRVCDTEQWVEIIHDGVLTLGGLTDARARAADMMVKTGLSRLLVDRRAADMTTLSVVDTYEFNTTHQSVFPFLGQLRIAVIIVRGQAEKALFAETVARNQGINLRVFEDATEARQWLAG